MREEAVLALSIAGLCDKEVAARLGIGVESVRTYWGRIKSKLNVEGRAEAVLEASNQDFAGILRTQEAENQILLQEVHRRQIAESLLSESEARFRFFCETSKRGVFMMDREGKCTYTNQRCNEIMGVPESALSGYGWLKLPWFPGSRKQLKKGFAEVERGGLHKHDYAFLLDRSRRDVRVAICAVSHVGGIAGYFGIVEDLTEEGALQAKFEEARRFGQCVSAATDDIVYLHDLPSSTTVYVNHVSEKLFGMTSEEIRLLGPNSLSMLIDPADYEHLAETQRGYASLKDGDAIRISFRAKAADGTKKTLTGKVVVYKRDRLGIPTIMLGVLRVSAEGQQAVVMSAAQEAMSA